MKKVISIPSTTQHKNIEAHLAQPLSGRNTVIVQGKDRRIRSRSWFLTLNNYTPEDVDTLTQDNSRISKYIIQKEIGKHGTPHLQGVIYLNNACGLKSMKDIHPTAHWEVANNWNACKNYCSKFDTRHGKIFRKGCRENRCQKGIKWDDILQARKDFLIDYINDLVLEV